MVGVARKVCIWGKNPPGVHAGEKEGKSQKVGKGADGAFRFRSLTHGVKTCDYIWRWENDKIESDVRQNV